MTQLDQPTEFDAKAAESGANATRVFQSKEATARPEISKERVDEVATAAIKALHEVIRDKQVTYQEYDALKAWMIQVGLDGEWPLFLDVWIEHVVEEVANADREGSKGTIEGPYYVPDAPELPAECTLEMREDEAGTPLLFQGQVRAVDGTPLAGATVDIWHADDAGFYAQFAPGLPDWLFRARVTADEEGTLLHQHDAARPLPDPDRRLLRQAHRSRRLARLATRPHPPQGLRTRPPADHHPAVLRRRRVRRHRHRRCGQARAHAGADAAFRR